MLVRLRFPELLAETGVSAYKLARQSGGSISPSTAYRLKRSRGRVGFVSMEMLEALCTVLNVSPGDLFERDGEKPRDKRDGAKPRSKGERQRSR